jgi:hypothetical protein
MDIPYHTKEAEEELTEYGHLLAKIQDIDLYTLRNLLAPYQLKQIFKQLFEHYEESLPLQYKIETGKYFQFDKTPDHEIGENFTVSFNFYGNGKSEDINKIKKSYKIVVENSLGMHALTINVGSDANNDYQYDIRRNGREFDDTHLTSILIISILSIRKFLYELYRSI